MNRRILHIACSALVAALAGGLAPVASRATETEVYLSWGSPHGTPGARDTLVRACGDSTRVDTLYLSFVPGEEFLLPATTNRVEITPVDGDTLLGYWSFKNDSRGPGNCWGEFGVSAAGCPSPWPVGPSLGGATFSRRDGKGALRVGYAAYTKKPDTLRTGTHYCLGRVLIQHRGNGSPGCDQPLRMAWTEAIFHQGRNQDLRVLSGRGRPVFLRTR